MRLCTCCWYRGTLQQPSLASKRGEGRGGGLHCERFGLHRAALTLMSRSAVRGRFAHSPCPRRACRHAGACPTRQLPPQTAPNVRLVGTMPAAMCPFPRKMGASPSGKLELPTRMHGALIPRSGRERGKPRWLTGARRHHASLEQLNFGVRNGRCSRELDLVAFLRGVCPRTSHTEVGPTWSLRTPVGPHRHAGRCACILRLVSGAPSSCCPSPPRAPWPLRVRPRPQHGSKLLVDKITCGVWEYRWDAEWHHRRWRGP